MNISINWTAASCIVALLLGLWNVAYSWVNEKRQRKREIRDKALDTAVQLATVTFRFQFAEDRNSALLYGTEFGGLCLALRAYGYPAHADRLRSKDPDVCDQELARLISTIIADSK